MGSKRYIFSLVCALTMFACGATQGKKTVDEARTGRPTTAKTVDFTLKDLDGNVIHLADHRDAIVIVTYFTTWCAPCAELLPLLNKLVSGPEAFKNVRTPALLEVLSSHEFFAGAS